MATAKTPTELLTDAINDLREALAQLPVDISSSVRSPLFAGGGGGLSSFAAGFRGATYGFPYGRSHPREFMKNELGGLAGSVLGRIDPILGGFLAGSSDIWGSRPGASPDGPERPPSRPRPSRKPKEHHDDLDELLPTGSSSSSPTTPKVAIGTWGYQDDIKRYADIPKESPSRVSHILGGEPDPTANRKRATDSIKDQLFTNPNAPGAAGAAAKKGWFEAGIGLAKGITSLGANPVAIGLGITARMVRLGEDVSDQVHERNIGRVAPFSGAYQNTLMQSALGDLTRDIKFSRATEATAIEAEQARNFRREAQLPWEIRAGNATNRIASFADNFIGTGLNSANQGPLGTGADKAWSMTQWINDQLTGTGKLGNADPGSGGSAGDWGTALGKVLPRFAVNVATGGPIPGAIMSFFGMGPGDWLFPDPKQPQGNQAPPNMMPMEAALRGMAFGIPRPVHMPRNQLIFR